MITDTPAIWLVNDMSAVRAGVLEEMMLNHPYDLWRQYPGGVYIHWNIWASYNPAILERNKDLFTRIHAVEVARREVQGRVTAVFRVEPGKLGPLYPERVTSDLDDVAVHKAPVLLLK